MKIKEKGELNYLFEGVDMYDIQEDQLTVEIDPKETNQPQALIICQTENGKQLSGEELQFLEKILGAVQLKLDDVAVVNLVKDQACHFNNLKQRVSFSTLLVFGVPPGDLALNINYKKYFEFELQSTKVLFADPLKDLMLDPQKKGRLWKGLQRLFDIGQDV